MKLYSKTEFFGGLFFLFAGALAAYLYAEKDKLVLAIIWGAYFLIWTWRSMKNAFHKPSYEKMLRARAVEKRYYREKYKRFAPVVQYGPLAGMAVGTVIMLLYVLAERGLLKTEFLTEKAVFFVGIGLFFFGIILLLLLGTGASAAVKEAEEDFQNNKNPTLD